MCEMKGPPRHPCTLAAASRSGTLASNTDCASAEHSTSCQSVIMHVLKNAFIMIRYLLRFGAMHVGTVRTFSLKNGAPRCTALASSTPRLSLESSPVRDVRVDHVERI
jgi:hypothetical protein